MDSGPGYVEFYIAPNPPLSPSGVREVKDRLHAMGPENYGKIIEVIYDPEVPWFRFLAEDTVRDNISECVNGILSEFGKQHRIETESSGHSSSSHLDADFGEDSCLMAWSANYEPAVYSRFNAFRFPQFVFDGDVDDQGDQKREPCFKAVWRGVEERWPTYAGIEDLFNRHNFSSLRNLTIESFKEHHGVEISWNLRGTIVYIASAEGRTNVERACNDLNRMIQKEPDHSHHQVVEDNTHASSNDDANEVVFW